MPKKPLSKKNFSINNNSKQKKSLLKVEKIKKISFWKPLLVAILFFVISLNEFFLNGESLLFWVFFVLSAIIIIPNLFWLKTGLGTIFGIPFISTMLKTKYFVKTIHNLGEHAKALEIISIIGLFLGFGLAGIDYWVAREKKGWKRILILVIGAIMLYLVFHFFLSILFLPPALAPLFLISLISFILLGLGGLSIGILVGYAFLSIVALFSVKQICPSVFPVLPGVPIPGIGVIVPFIAWVSLGMILIIHEFSHGIMLSKYKEKIKSVGLILFGIIPMGAFVEQDDKTFMKKNEREQILVLSAGPSSNLFTMAIGFVVFVLLIIAMTPISLEINNEYSKTYSGVKIVSVQDEVSFCGITELSPAKNFLFKDDIVLSLNDVNISNMTMLNKVFNNSEKMDFLVLRNNEEIQVKLNPIIFEDLNIKRIGVEFASIPTGYEPPLHIKLVSMISSSILNILFFFWILSFAVGMFNFLPSDPLDGGRIAKFVLTPYFSFLKMSKKETMKFIGRLFAWIFVISIILNLLPYVTMFLI